MWISKQNWIFVYTESYTLEIYSDHIEFNVPNQKIPSDLQFQLKRVARSDLIKYHLKFSEHYLCNEIQVDSIKGWQDEYVCVVRMAWYCFSPIWKCHMHTISWVKMRVEYPDEGNQRWNIQLDTSFFFFSLFFIVVVVVFESTVRCE